MTLDDRLATVLHAQSEGQDQAESARAQYRQLVDLLGSGGVVADGSLVARAFMRLRTLSRRISAKERAAILAEPAMRIRSAPLVARLCEDEDCIGRAAIASARLDPGGWAMLADALDDPLRKQALAAAAAARSGAAEADEVEAGPPPETPAAARDGADPALAVRHPPLEQQERDVSALASRIEEFCRRRQQAQSTPPGGSGTADDAPFAGAAKAADDTAAAAGLMQIDCMIDSDGCIAGADSHAPMLAGFFLSAQADAPVRLSPADALILRRRQPLRGAALRIAAAPAVSGAWTMDAMPQFDEAGSFSGYHARLSRSASPALAGDPRGDSIRAALHELRTPLNALQGFAEIIQQQMFGPVPHQYRAIAASIAADSAQMLSGFEDVERLVRLRQEEQAPQEGETALRGLVEAVCDRLAPVLGERGADLALAQDGDPVVALSELEAERIVWRLLAVVAGSAGEAERLSVRVHGADGRARLVAELPRELAAQDDASLFSAEAPDTFDRSLSIGLLGRGFALRLAAAEARAAGGELARKGGRLELVLPLADAYRPLRDNPASDALAGQAN